MLSNLRSSQVRILVLLTAERKESHPSCFTHFFHLHFQFSRLICSQLLSISISGDRKSIGVALIVFVPSVCLQHCLLQNFGHLQGCLADRCYNGGWVTRDLLLETENDQFGFPSKQVQNVQRLVIHLGQCDFTMLTLLCCQFAKSSERQCACCWI